jgi:hypothetical protein
MRPSQINTRINGKVAVQPAEAVLFRLMACGAVEMEKIVRFGGSVTDAADGL